MLIIFLIIKAICFFFFILEKALLTIGLGFVFLKGPLKKNLIFYEFLLKSGLKQKTKKQYFFLLIINFFFQFGLNKVDH